MDQRRHPQDGAAGTNLRRRRSDRQLPPPARLPWGWIAVDGVGALLFALGAAEYFGGMPLLSRVVADGDAALTAMIVGVVLMAVAMAAIVRALVGRR